MPHSQIASDLRSLIIIHILITQIAISKVTMIIIKPEGQQLQKLTFGVDFVEPERKFVDYLDAVIAPSGCEIQTQIFEGEISKLFCFACFAIDHWAQSCELGKDVHCVFIINELIFICAKQTHKHLPLEITIFT